MGRYAIKTPPQNANWEDMLAIWREADDIDLFESAWNFDHFYPIHGDPNGPCMEAWVTLTALAQATSRIRIGCMVNGMHFRHPAITANMAASLDIVSGGRLYLGLGAGWQEQEASSYGLHLGTMTERMDRFDEGVEVIVRLLTQETTDFEGEHYRLTAARCEPKPIQRPESAHRHRRWRREAHAQDRGALGGLVGWAPGRARGMEAQARGACRPL